MLAEVAICVPELTLFMAKCRGEKIECSRGVQQGDATGLALFCIPLLPVLKWIREEFEPRGIEAFACLDDISIGMSEVTPDTVRVVRSLQHLSLIHI